MEEVVWDGKKLARQARRLGSRRRMLEDEERGEQMGKEQKQEGDRKKEERKL